MAEMSGSDLTDGTSASEPEEETLFRLVKQRKWEELCQCLDVASDEEVTHRIQVAADAAETDLSLLHVAAACSAPRNVIGKLVERGLHPDDKNCDGAAALHFGVEHRASEDTHEALVEFGASVDLPDNQGRTPLHFAAIERRKSLRLVKLLLTEFKSRALSLKDAKGMTPFHHALIWDNDLHILPVMLKVGCETDPNNPLLLLLAIAARQSSLAERLMRKGVSVTFRDEVDGRTALHWAARTSCPANLVRMLLEKGADKDALDNDGKTPKEVALSVENQVFLATLAEYEKHSTSMKKVKELERDLRAARRELCAQQLSTAKAALILLTEEKVNAQASVSQAEEQLEKKKAALAACSKMVQMKTEEIARLETTAQEDNEGEAFICRICLVNRVSRMLNCGHTYCSTCVEKISCMRPPRCSFCNQSFTKTTKLFFSD